MCSAIVGDHWQDLVFCDWAGAGLGARLPNTIARRCWAGLLARLPKEAALPFHGLLGRLTVSLMTCAPALFEDFEPSSHLKSA